MSQFDSDFAAVGAPELIAQFGEDVIYAPSPGLTPGVAPVPRTIKAIVNRGDVGALMQLKGVAPKMTFEVLNDATDGIAAADQPWNGGTITVAYVIGLAAQAYLIKRAPGPYTEDAAMLTLAL